VVVVDQLMETIGFASQPGDDFANVNDTFDEEEEIYTDRKTIWNMSEY
jgi:hypothetical protein